MSSIRRSRRAAKNESIPGIGAANEDDEPARRRETTSSASISTREIPGKHVPSLSKLCARVASQEFRRIGREETWNTTKYQLDRLPDPILKMLFAMLRMDCPTVLNHALLSQVGLSHICGLRIGLELLLAFSARLVDYADSFSSWGYQAHYSRYREDER